MKILYTTDLHGNQHYYNLTWEKAVEHKVDMIINGGDLDNIEDWVSVAQSLPIIEDELKALPRPRRYAPCFCSDRHKHHGNETAWPWYGKGTLRYP